MKKPIGKYNENKHLQAYLVVIADRIAGIEGKLDMIQKSISDEDAVAKMNFLDPKRKRIEALMMKKHKSDINNDISAFLKLIDSV